MSDSFNVSLLINSHAFLREAAKKSVAAESDPKEWPFAVVNVAQALELTMKAMLERIHPVFVLENIDEPRRTVTPMSAAARLRNPAIGSVSISEAEVLAIRRVMELRNQFLHSAFEVRPEHAAAKFFETFAFVADFQARHLGTELEHIVDPETLGRLLTAERGNRELAARAVRRIEDEEVPSEYVWLCPDCGNETFVAYDGTDTRYTCRFTEPVAECPHCRQLKRESDLVDFSELFEWADASGGRYHLHNNFGYHEHEACATCYFSIREDIDRQRSEDDYYDRMTEEYYSRFGHMP